MKDEDEDSPARAGTSESADESVDSLVRAVARATPRPLAEAATFTMPGRSDMPVAERDRRGPPTTLPSVGEVFDERYAIESVLGSGGMGIVYSARNLRTHKEVALKVLHAPHGDTQQRSDRAARFEREARAAGRIRHPNVVDVYDVGGDPRAPYLVMERLHGESLRERMDLGALSVDEALALLIPALHGVAAAHEQRVIHRDLKPDNIFLARELGSELLVPKVLDFGVSRIVATDDDRERSATITKSGYVLGTPSYMPLEQLRGDPDVDARADVYALGVVLYEALSGRRPHEAANDRELVLQLATGKAVPLRKHLPSIDPRLDAIVTKALARDVGDRYPDVLTFARALEGIREGTAPRAITAASRNWALSVLLAAALLLAWFALRAREPQPSVTTTRSADSLREAPASARRDPAADVAGRPASAPAQAAPVIEKPASPAPTPPARPRKPVDRATKLLPADF